MKALWLMFALFFCGAANMYSQTSDTVVYKEINPNKNAGGFSLVDQWPMYPGGKEGVDEHIKNELNYPEEALKDSIVGRVLVRYVVQTDGSVGEVEVVEGVHPLLDAEAIRVIEAMDRWKPAIQRGKPTKAAYLQAFNFHL